MAGVNWTPKGIPTIVWAFETLKRTAIFYEHLAELKAMAPMPGISWYLPRTSPKQSTQERPPLIGSFLVFGHPAEGPWAPREICWVKRRMLRLKISRARKLLPQFQSGHDLRQFVEARPSSPKEQQPIGWQNTHGATKLCPEFGHLMDFKAHLPKLTNLNYAALLRWSPRD